MNTLGQPLVIGIPSTQLSPGERELIKSVQPGGFILFARNLRSPEQVFELIADLNELCDIQPIITIDQEGGRVSRLAQIGETPPSGYDLCLTESEDFCRAHGELTGKLLRCLGFNLNLAPVVDYSVDESMDNSLRGRCLGRNPEEVIRNATAFLTGMQSQKVAGTAKHFPGYTYCLKDPHGDLPKIERTREELEGSELVAFRAFLDTAESMMIGHGHFTTWHQDPWPASLSKDIITGLLKKEMKYQGLIMTDDLEMGAITNRWNAKAVSRLALEAGNEILLFCHNPACVQLAFEELCELSDELVQPAVRKVMQFKENLSPVTENFDAALWKQLNEETAEMREAVASKIS